MSAELIDIIDFMDLINFTLSSKFVEIWRHKYSEKFIANFQNKLIESMQRQKPIKINTLVSALQKNNTYSKEQVLNFFDSIDIDLYRPLVTGSLR